MADILIVGVRQVKLHIALSGNNQSKATADVAAHVVRRLLENPPTQHGVFYLEDGFDIQEFGYTLDFIDHSSPRLEHP